MSLREPVEPPISPCALTTARLRLRTTSAADIPFIDRAQADPRVGLGIGTRYPYDSAKATDWIAKIPDELKHGTRIPFTITRATTAEPSSASETLGLIGASLNLNSARATLWYWLDFPHWNQGLATEAASAVIDYLFHTLRLNRIDAFHHPDNPASGRVMQKLGMSYEARLRQHARRDTQFVDSLLYSLLAEEWPPK